MVLKAGVADVKSTASATGAFAWSENDRIFAFDVWSNTQVFRLTAGAGTNNAEFTSENPVDGLRGYAFLADDSPFVWSNQCNLYMTPYYGDEAIGMTHSPMIAAIPSGSSPTLAFKHLCGLIKLTIKGFSGQLYKVSLTSLDKPIAGNLDVTDYGTDNARIEAQDGGDKTIEYSVSRSIDGDIDFYFPVPVGTYQGFQFKVEYRTSKSEIYNYLNIDREVTIARGELRTAEMTVVPSTELSDILYAEDGKVFHTTLSVVSAVAEDPSKGYVITGEFGYPSVYVSGNAGTLRPGCRVYVSGKKETSERGFAYLSDASYELLYIDSERDMTPWNITSQIDYFTAYSAEYVQVTGVATTVGSSLRFIPTGATKGVDVYALGKGVTLSAKAGDEVTLIGFVVDQDEDKNVQMLVTQVNN